MISRFALVKQKLQDNIGDVIPAVFGANASPKRRKLRRWAIVNPWSASKSANLSVYLSGPKCGGWIDFTTGDKGDAIDLVAYGQAGIVTDDSRKRAVEWAEDRYGIRDMSPAARRDQAEAAAKRQKQWDEQARAGQQAQRERVRKAFYAAQARLAGTPVERYLELPKSDGGRGIPLADIPFMSASFRYRPDAEYWPLAEYDEDGKRVTPGPRFPALVSAMVSGDGSLNALHYTFLAPDGRGKAPVAQLAASRGLDPDDFSAKLFKGDVQGFVIRCTNGPSGLTPTDAAAAGVSGPCGLTEGIEDALSAAILSPRLRMWAAGSLSGLLHVPDHTSVSGWLVFKDNDWGKPQAAALFDRAIARLRSFGKPLEIVAMPADWGKDINDALTNQET